MTDEQKKKKPGRGIGGISPYGTFGSSNGETSENPGTSIAERPNIQTSRLPDTETVRYPNVKKSKHPDWKQQTIYFPPALIEWAKIQAIQSKMEISEIVTQALREYRDEIEERKKS